MEQSTQEVQGFALQQAASQLGVLWQPRYGNRLTKGAQYILKQAELRGVVIQAYGDLSQQTFRVLTECMIEAGTAFATGFLSLQAINQQVKGTEGAMAVMTLNANLQNDFAQYIRTIFGLTAQAMGDQFGPFAIPEEKRNWIQRLLGVD